MKLLIKIREEALWLECVSGFQKLSLQYQLYSSYTKSSWKNIMGKMVWAQKVDKTCSAFAEQ
jgi:hypothetical protein